MIFRFSSSFTVVSKKSTLLVLDSDVNLIVGCSELRYSTETLQGRYPHQKCENFNTLSQFSQ